MRRSLPLALCLLGPILAAAPAAAQIRQGVYEIEGTNPDGSAYRGAFALEEAPGASWYAIWQVGDARLVGLGLIQGGNDNTASLTIAGSFNGGANAFGTNVAGDLGLTAGLMHQVGDDNAITHDVLGDWKEILAGNIKCTCAE